MILGCSLPLVTKPLKYKQQIYKIQDNREREMDEKVNEIIPLFFPFARENLPNIVENEYQKQVEKINGEIQKNIEELKELNQEAKALGKEGHSSIKVENCHITKTKEQFMEEMAEEEIIDTNIIKGVQKSRQISFQKIQRTWQKMESFLSLKLDS